MIYLKTCSVGVKQQSLTHWQYGNEYPKYIYILKRAEVHHK